MRKVKFRGLCGNKWVYGFLQIAGKVAYISNLDKQGFFQTFVVDIETVGQFTGLKDRNGKEIHEGDIIKIGLGEIFWNERQASFMVRWHNKKWQNIRGMEELLFQNSEISFEIIGNIYKNSEFLEN